MITTASQYVLKFFFFFFFFFFCCLRLFTVSARSCSRLDRLVLTDGGVSIVDFKLGAKPYRAAAAHVAQLALYRAALKPQYPELPIRAALVYLDGPTLAPIGEAELEATLEAVVAAA